MRVRRGFRSGWGICEGLFRPSAVVRARAEPTNSPFPTADCRLPNADCHLKKTILDFSPKIAHIILHPHPMRDWTRAVVFGWVGSGSCGMGYRSPFLGRSLQKAWVVGWPPGTMPVASKPFGGMPSHPSVRHYDRSELVKLTNPGCGQAVVRQGPFEASGPSV